MLKSKDVKVVLLGDTGINIVYFSVKIIIYL
jgi:hypothetical protein